MIYNKTTQYWIDQGSTDAIMVPADENGRHPKFSHLVLYELEPHYCSWIVTSPAISGSVLLSQDDCISMFGKEAMDSEVCFGTDEYLELFTKKES